MEIKLPHTIENCIGEKLVFQSIEKNAIGDKVLLEAYCKPGCGPSMHTHFKQDESLTVLSGKMGYQVLGEEIKYAEAGDTVQFDRGTPHKFWAEGSIDLHCKGWVAPVNSIVFYLSALYAAQNKSGKGQPEQFDGAFLIHRYASEYDIPEMPGFVKKVIIPITYQIGKLLGKYKHFQGAPAPL